MSEKDSALVSAAKAVGRAAGRAAKIVGAEPAVVTTAPVPEDLFKSTYIGSGTFIIKKPKKNSRKTHQQRVKNDRRGRI
jgi:hypothetical protein